jgi:hypothetical protein
VDSQNVSRQKRKEKKQPIWLGKCQESAQVEATVNAIVFESEDFMAFGEPKMEQNNNQNSLF